MAEELVAPPQTQTDHRPPPLSSPSTSSHSQAVENQDPHYNAPQSAPGAISPIIASYGAISVAPSQNLEQNIDLGQGLYVVQYTSHMGKSPEYSSAVLIPLKFKIPTRSNTSGEENGQGGEAVMGPNGAAQRQVVVRRYVFEFQLDLPLLLKLAFAVVLFSQDGSRQRTILLILLATLIYLYQTGVLSPLIRYARRALTPPQPFAARQQNDQRQQQPGGAENEAEAPVREGNEEGVERGNNQGMNLVGIAREIQTFVLGFIASLLPGYEHPHND